MLKSFVLTLLVTCICGVAFAGPVERVPESVVAPPMSYDPLDHWEFSFESGALWRVGGNGSQRGYVIVPQILTLKSPTAFDLGEIAGGDLVLRNRFSLLLEPIVAGGAEDYYFGASASGSLEWWNKPRTFSLFFAAGGGFGWMNSKGHELEDAQGQDFNFNWFLYSGARWMCWERMSVSLGVLYQHVSNTGLDDVNPGIDALGPMLGLTWHF
jgi:lipid A 3-O-deacylase